MIYSYVYGNVRKYARASNAIEARIIFVRSIKAELREEIERFKNDALITDAMLRLKSVRVSLSQVFEYCEDSENAVNAPGLDEAVKTATVARDGYANLRAYQKPSQRDWSYIPQKRETLHVKL